MDCQIVAKFPVTPMAEHFDIILGEDCGRAVRLGIRSATGITKIQQGDGNYGQQGDRWFQPGQSWRIADPRFDSPSFALCDIPRRSNAVRTIRSPATHPRTSASFRWSATSNRLSSSSAGGSASVICTTCKGNSSSPCWPHLPCGGQIKTGPQRTMNSASLRALRPGMRLHVHGESAQFRQAVCVLFQVASTTNAVRAPGRPCAPCKPAPRSVGRCGIGVPRTRRCRSPGPPRQSASSLPAGALFPAATTGSRVFPAHGVGRVFPFLGLRRGGGGFDRPTPALPPSWC